MTPTEKWNALSASADGAVAITVFVAGIAMLAAKKKFAAARQARVESGAMTREEAEKAGKLIRWCSYGIVFCGAFLLILWMTGH